MAARRWRGGFFAFITHIFSKRMIGFAWAPAGIASTARCSVAHCESWEGVSSRLHECGHAVVSLLTPGAAPIDKITVVPRGDVGHGGKCETGRWGMYPRGWRSIGWRRRVGGSYVR